MKRWRFAWRSVGDLPDDEVGLEPNTVDEVLLLEIF